MVRLAMDHHRVQAVTRAMIRRHGRGSGGQLEIGLDSAEINGRVTERRCRSTAAVDRVVVQCQLVGTRQPNAISSRAVDQVVTDDRVAPTEPAGYDPVLRALRDGHMLDVETGA